MISFKLLTSESEREILDLLAAALPDADKGEIFDILSSFSDSPDEIAFSAAHGCVLIRIFDSEYLFVYPVAMSDNADERLALNEIRLYTIKEEIPFVLVDTPVESLNSLSGMFRQTDVYAEDSPETSYTVRVKNELSSLEDIPEVIDGELSLSPITDEDAALYERIATDREVNKYWGYDYIADRPDADGEYFVKCANEEREREVSLALAVRCNGKMIGEAILYAFDFLGGCECAIRLTKEEWGRGYGRRVLLMLMSLAGEIRLSRLYATVQKENTQSLSLFAKEMNTLEENEETIRFYTDL